MDLREIVVAVREAVDELNVARTQLLQLTQVSVALGRPNDQPGLSVAAFTNKDNTGCPPAAPTPDQADTPESG